MDIPVPDATVPAAMLIVSPTAELERQALILARVAEALQVAAQAMAGRKSVNRRSNPKTRPGIIPFIPFIIFNLQI
jgi:hypothetical protein